MIQTRRAVCLLASPSRSPPLPARSSTCTPPRGRLREKQKSDEAACHSWAVQQTGFDPAKAPPPAAAAPTTGDRHDSGRGRARRGEGRGDRRRRGRRRRHRRGWSAPPPRAARVARQNSAAAQQQQEPPASSSRPLSPRRVPLAWKARVTPSNDAGPRDEATSPSALGDARGRAGSGAGRNFPASSAFAQTPAPAPAPAAAAAASPDIPLTAEELEQLVARIALYPDDLVAIILPASTNPLQIVQADRFLAKRKADPKAPLDDKWDDAVKSLLNYPEVVTMMSGDLDWTAALGEAVVADQGEVLEAVQAFRRKTQAAGNLKTDPKQTVVVEKEVIKIVPTDPQVIYVPQYNPTTVVVSGGYSSYGYYPAPYPVYYYPYPPGAALATGLIWGAAIGAVWGGNRYGANYGGGNNNINVNRNTNINTGNTNVGSGNRGRRTGRQLFPVEVEQAAGAGQQVGRRDAVARGRSVRRWRQRRHVGPWRWRWWRRRWPQRRHVGTVAVAVVASAVAPAPARRTVAVAVVASAVPAVDRAGVRSGARQHVERGGGGGGRHSTATARVARRRWTARAVRRAAARPARRAAARPERLRSRPVVVAAAAAAARWRRWWRTWWRRWSSLGDGHEPHARNRQGGNDHDSTRTPEPRAASRRAARVPARVPADGAAAVTGRRSSRLSQRPQPPSTRSPRRSRPTTTPRSSRCSARSTRTSSSAAMPPTTLPGAPRSLPR